MSQASIFIVEDELIEAEDIRQTLKKQGYSVMGIARSGESCLETLKGIRPDLVLMDIHLAGVMDGIDTAEQVRALYTIPVIFLTAHADDTSLSRAKVTEPYGYVLKPFDERELHSAIEMALYKHRMEVQARENERTIRILANTIPDPVMLLDRNQTVIAVNDAMTRRLSRDHPATGRAPVVQLAYDGVITSVESQLEESLKTSRPVHFEEKDGDLWFEIALVPIPDPDPDRTWFILQYHDITASKKIEEQLKKEGLTRIEQNMEQFQILNDQIRNPLQAIMGFVNLDCEKNRDRIMQQIGTIDNLVSRLDRGWIESEKVRRFLIRHYRTNAGDAQDPGDLNKSGGA
jgi:PAS domain S-box-containing protein